MKNLTTRQAILQNSGELKGAETWLYVKQPNLKLKAAIVGGFYNPEH